MEFCLAVKQVPLVLFFLCFLILNCVTGVEILSKSKLERCEKISDSDKLNCSEKIVVNTAVPSGTLWTDSMYIPFSEWGRSFYCLGSSGVRGEHNPKDEYSVNTTCSDSQQICCICPDVPYKPVEYHVKTRKCEPDADAGVVKICERFLLFNYRRWV